MDVFLEKDLVARIGKRQKMMNKKWRQRPWQPVQKITNDAIMADSAEATKKMTFYEAGRKKANASYPVTENTNLES